MRKAIAAVLILTVAAAADEFETSLRAGAAELAVQARALPAPAAPAGVEPARPAIDARAREQRMVGAASVVVESGTFEGRPAWRVSDGGAEPIQLVSMGKAKDFDSASALCAGLAPAGAWSLPPTTYIALAAWVGAINGTDFGDVTRYPLWVDSGEHVVVHEGRELVISDRGSDNFGTALLHRGTEELGELALGGNATSFERLSELLDGVSTGLARPGLSPADRSLLLKINASLGSGVDAVCVDRLRIVPFQR